MEWFNRKTKAGINTKGVKIKSRTRKGWTKLWKKKEPTLESLVSKLDKVFSRYKRMSNMTQGYIRCFTCGGFFTYAQIDCGHFISRTYMNTRYMEENTEPQCRKCNRFLEGVKDVFALNLQKKYGVDILQKLNDKKNEFRLFKPFELEELIETYEQKIKEYE